MLRIFLFAENTLIEHDDHVEVNGVVFNKPFVEKPVSAEDHNIYMYYPTSAGMNHDPSNCVKLQFKTPKIILQDFPFSTSVFIFCQVAGVSGCFARLAAAAPSILLNLE